MPPIKVDDKLVNLSQATYINLRYREGPDDTRDASRIAFGPGKFLVLFAATAEKFRNLDSLAVWTRNAIVVDDTLINPDQITYADLKFRSSALLPPGVKDAVHIAFAAGNEITLIDDQAAKFRDGYKQLASR